MERSERVSYIKRTMSPRLERACHVDESITLLQEASRWQSRRTWSSSLPTNASGRHLQMEQFSQSPSWTLAEDLRHLKGQALPPGNQVG